MKTQIPFGNVNYTSEYYIDSNETIIRDDLGDELITVSEKLTEAAARYIIMGFRAGYKEREREEYRASDAYNPG
jgi:hypothetical protein